MSYANRVYRRNYKLVRKYGITLKQRDAIFESQGKVCACCGSDNPKHRYGWVVDHCHITGRVRGILCTYCNIRLGRLGDTLEKVRSLLPFFETIPIPDYKDIAATEEEARTKLLRLINGAIKYLENPPNLQR